MTYTRTPHIKQRLQPFSGVDDWLPWYEARTPRGPLGSAAILASTQARSG